MNKDLWELEHFLVQQKKDFVKGKIFTLDITTIDFSVAFRFNVFVTFFPALKLDVFQFALNDCESNCLDTSL